MLFLPVEFWRDLGLFCMGQMLAASIKPTGRRRTRAETRTLALWEHRMELCGSICIWARGGGDA